MPNADLIAHNDQFRKSIMELTAGVWTAVGYAASNVHMIEGKTSVTIVDTSESTKAAENILADFRKVCEKPIGRIVYTHSHRDHISGASVFCTGVAVPILAASSFQSDLVAVDGSVIAPNKALGRRTQAQFGIGLTPEQRVSLGCGPGDRPMQGLGAGFVEPTRYIESDTEIDLDGIQARLILAPGETADHMVVWLPESNVLFSGDNWYHAFPNLYAIRGTPFRDYSTWAASLELLANLNPEVLAPGHTLPVKGREKIQEVLNTTREAITYVMQATAECMDSGMSMDDIAASVQLPEHLASKPWLGEFYGKVSWSARSFAVGTLGWYDGNPTHLGTLSTASRARHMAELSGGVEAMAEAAQQADDLQWRLELCDFLIALDHPSEMLKADTLELMAESEINATARNTYLWEAKRLREHSG